MNGNRYLLDTNAIIAILPGDNNIKEIISNAEWLGTSVICVLGFYSFPGMSAQDKLLLDYFITKINLVYILPERNILAEIARFKIETKLKLPDAIIGSCAKHNNATLISNDKHFENITSLRVLKFD